MVGMQKYCQERTAAELAAGGFGWGASLSGRKTSPETWAHSRPLTWLTMFPHWEKVIACKGWGRDMEK